MKTKKMIVSTVLLMAHVAMASPVQSVQSIQDAVRAYVKSGLESGGKYEIGNAQLDPRLQLPLCEQSLQVFSQSGEIKAGRNTIAVRCNGDRGWTIYSAISLKYFKDVLVLAKPLRRGDVIRTEHLTTETRDVATLQQGYLLDPAEVIDKQASHNLMAGSVLNRLSCQDLTLVKRGERVNIRSGKAGFVISAMGMAMADGVKGESIRVKNIASQRVIQAVVVDIGVVLVN